MGAVGVHGFDNVAIYVGGTDIENNKAGGSGDKVALPANITEAALDALAVADNLIDEAVLGFTGGGSTPPTGGRFVYGRSTPKRRAKATEFNDITLTLENDRTKTLSKALMDAPRGTNIWVLEKADDGAGHTYYLHVADVSNVVKETPVGDTETISQMVITLSPTQDVATVDDSA